MLAACAMLAAATASSAEEGWPRTLTPYFLVATRSMGDPMFQHSVILMIPSAETQLLAGVILNKATAVPVHALFPNETALKDKSEIAYFGGPVEPSLPVLIFRAPKGSGGSVHVFADIYASVDPVGVAELLKGQASVHRVILGRAQWLRDQLHAEVAEGSWYMIPARPELVFSDPSSLWRDLVQEGELQEAGRGNPISFANSAPWAAAAR